MLRQWTIGRATGIGVLAAAISLLLRAFYNHSPDTLFWPLFLTSAVAGFSGASILLITFFDLLFHRRRGFRIRPMRAFDLVLATLLIGLAFLVLEMLLGQLPAQAVGG